MRLVGYFLFAMNLFADFRIIRSKLPDDIIRCFVLLFLSLPLVVSTSWPRYFVFLPFCQTYLITEAFKKKRFSGPLNVTAIILILVSAVLSSIFFFNSVGNREIYTGYGSLLIACLVLMIAFYLQHLPLVRNATASDSFSG